MLISVHINFFARVSKKFFLNLYVIYILTLHNLISIYKYLIYTIHFQPFMILLNFHNGT
jgi:hypothetical protein